MSVSQLVSQLVTKCDMRELIRHFLSDTHPIIVLYYNNNNTYNYRTTFFHDNYGVGLIIGKKKKYIAPLYSLTWYNPYSLHKYQTVTIKPKQKKNHFAKFFFFASSPSSLLPLLLPFFFPSSSLLRQWIVITRKDKKLGIITWIIQ